MRELFRRQPKFRPGGAESRARHVPDDLWEKCAGCGELVYTRELARSLRVCHRCGHHFRLSARERLNQLADDGSFVEWDAGLTTADPLGFHVGADSYQTKARSTASRSDSPESAVSGRLDVLGRPVAVFITDFAFMGASMGSVYGEKLVRTAEHAIDEHLPLLSVNCSGGARMQEGIFSLMQMAKTSAMLTQLGAARLPHFSLLVDPCYGGVTASYATTADIVMAEPGAKIGLTGPRVIEQVTRQKLPDGFQTAEFLFDHGLIDLVVPRTELRERLASLIDVYGQARAAVAARLSESIIQLSGVQRAG
jgi:acetyl-CoA carboxylase carboxyl transferase subunit beta